MSKELEALSYLVETSIYGNKENNRGKIFESEDAIKQALEKIEELEKGVELCNEQARISHEQDMKRIRGLQHVPTEEEVCKALSEYYGFKIKYNNVKQWFYSGDLIIIWRIHLNDYFISKPLRKDLITMIGRFYEGGKK